MSIVGYARVSSSSQNLDIQLEQLADAGCEKVFSEKVTGTSRNDRQAVAEFETDIRKERQREGIERAKAAGVYKGRKRTVDADQVRSLRDQELGATDAGDRASKRLSSAERRTCRSEIVAATRNREVLDSARVLDPDAANQAVLRLLSHPPRIERPVRG